VPLQTLEIAASYQNVNACLQRTTKPSRTTKSSRITTSSQPQRAQRTQRVPWPSLRLCWFPLSGSRTCAAPSRFRNRSARWSC